MLVHCINRNTVNTSIFSVIYHTLPLLSPPKRKTLIAGYSDVNSNLRACFSFLLRVPLHRVSTEINISGPYNSDI